MENSFTAKTEDFVHWCETAFAHYKNGYYADSLTNMRKSGEAACKLMVIYKYSDKVAENKITHKGYKELIELVIREDLAPRRIINWLEALQIHGNMATHDNRVMQEQAHYSITALRLLIDWVFSAFLKIIIPSRLKKAMAQIEEISVSKGSGNKLEQELEKIKKDKEELEKQLNLLKGKGEQESEKIQKLTNELQKSVSGIKELEETQQRIKLLEQELTQAKKESEERKHQQSITIPDKNRKKIYSRKIVLVVLLPIALITSLFILFKMFSTESGTSKETVSANNQPAVRPDTLKVLILPLTILQDNPNISIKFEEALESHVRQKIVEHNLPMSIFYNSSFHKSSVLSEDAIGEGEKVNAALVVYGELYEPGTSDSAQVNVKFSLTRRENRLYDETGVKSFVHLTDSFADNVRMEVECFIEFAMAAVFKKRKKYSNALALLYEVKPISVRQRYNLSMLLSECHFALKNYDATIKELEKYIAMDSASGYPYTFMANVLKKTGRISEAEKYYEKSLKMEPNNVTTLLNYADLLADRNSESKLYRAKELVLYAIKYDSTVALAWQYLGDIEYLTSEIQNARDHYLKCLAIDSTNKSAKISLAQILAFKFNEPEKAVEYLSSILKKDSNDVEALFLMGNIYTSTKHKDAHKAEYLFKKSEQYSPAGNESSIQHGLGMAAHDKGDYKKAEEHYLKAYSMDSSNMTLIFNISQVYVAMSMYHKTLHYLQLAYKKDSMNPASNYNLGFFYCLKSKYFDMDKAIFYFERSIKTNPYDTLTLEYLGRLHFENGRMDRAKELFTNLNSISAKNFTANKYLGLFMEREEKYDKAIPYYQKAIEVNPNDWEANSKLSFVMMKVSKTKNINKSLTYAKRAVELNPQSADAMYILAQCLILNNEYYKGGDYYRKAIEINPALKDTGVERALSKKGL